MTFKSPEKPCSLVLANNLSIGHYSSNVKCTYQRQQDWMGDTSPYMPTPVQQSPSSKGQMPKNFKTVACRNYHYNSVQRFPPGFQECNRGSNCHFIHIEAFRGRELPQEVLNQLRNNQMTLG